MIALLSYDRFIAYHYYHYCDDYENHMIIARPKYMRTTLAH